MELVFLDVQMWTPLRGNYRPFTDVVCDAPDPAPTDVITWQHWAHDHLAAVAGHDGWQPGRYHFSVEHRDDADHTLQVFARGLWDYQPA